NDGTKATTEEYIKTIIIPRYQHDNNESTTTMATPNEWHQHATIPKAKKE
ncbi:8930_t:CDS:1, partial [Dentiscutata erythropus]